ncbi:MAG: carboxypeptidase-like regulatory domain-containing protein [Spartobacteria bacterium]
MITPLRIIVSASGGLLMLTASAWATGAGLEGIVKDPDGRPVKNAEVRVEGLEGSGKARIGQTDVKGHYTCSGMATGTFNVSLYVDGTMKASVAEVKMEEGRISGLDFIMRRGKATQPSRKGKQFVWLPSGTGTNISGRWVEVDEKGKIVRGTEERGNYKTGNIVKSIQDNSSGSAVRH